MDQRTGEPRRQRLRAALGAPEEQAPLVGLRSLNAADIPELGELMYAAYAGTPDEADAGGSIEAATREVARTFDGEYGLLVAAASFGAVDETGRLCAAALVTLWDDEPLLAYVFTAPEHQGKGLASQVIKAVMTALAQSGRSHLSLAVTEANTTATKLYRQLGFTPEPA